ncbi:DEAD/DEAH box helicase [Candidatus Pelagibacter sp.]|nr:DEAD/DEAH box helicase [Candidatus Pelagibacter sp.]
MERLDISQIKMGNLPFCKISLSKNFNNKHKSVWTQIRESLKQYQGSDFDEETESSILVEWTAFLQFLRTLGEYKRTYDFEVKYTNEAKKFVSDLVNSSKPLDDTEEIKIDNASIKDLKALGFKLNLKDYQVKNLKKLLSRRHGANFSVQGSGKTAVTIAMHLLLRNNKKTNVNSLIVVSPKNAFLAWDEGFAETLNINCPMRHEGLTELKGTYDQIKALLLTSGKRNFIVNYEKLINITSLIGSFVYQPNNNVHVVLDESHKIKTEEADRSNAAKEISTLPFIRKDILTGTPLPNKPEDINSQYKFLFPFSVPPSNDKYWVRTTKKELNLPKPNRIFQNIKMSKPQKELYGAVMTKFLNKYSNISKVNKDSLRDVRKSIIRLIMISSNPILLTHRMIENGEFYFGDDISSKIHMQLQEEENSGGSPKIKWACNKARQLAKEGKKTIIWSYFRNNIEHIGKYYLRDLNAVYIHGGIETGEVGIENTRKDNIKRFKDKDSDCMVLVANYASCAEGISLQHACHNAIYLDRSFQADLYLQSEDRICRLGNEDQKNIYILQSEIPRGVRNIELTIKNNLERKIDNMSKFLNDPDLKQMAIDESEGEMPIDENINMQDIKSMLDDLIKTR